LPCYYKVIKATAHETSTAPKVKELDTAELVVVVVEPEEPVVGEELEPVEPVEPDELELEPVEVDVEVEGVAG
jgi:hypothetical protein